MKKRIFIAMHYLEIGGAETSLIGMLNSFDFTKYEVDLFLYSHRGEMMKYIPKEVNLLPEIKEYSCIELPIKETFLKGCFTLLLGRIIGKLKFSQYQKKYRLKEGSAIFQYIHDEIINFLPSLDKFGEYDLAISYLTPHNIVLKKVLAKKKIAWIHTDYSKISINKEKELPIWSNYNYIASISDDVTKSFLKVFPSLENKIVLIENILSEDVILSRSNEEKISFIKENNEIHLLTIGRFTYPKNLENIPDICRRIREKGLNIIWHIIGYGGDEQLIKDKIKECDASHYVHLLGKKENPYPYIKACDIYVQPSRFEGKSVTVREAQILGKPVIITNYPTAKSQVDQGYDGIIVPLDNQGCSEGIYNFIVDKNIQNKIISELKIRDFSNKNSIYTLYKLI